MLILSTQKIEQFCYRDAAPFWLSTLLVLVLVAGVEIGLRYWYAPDKVAALSPQEIINRSPDVFGNAIARVIEANAVTTRFERRVFIFGGSTVMAALVSDTDLERISGKQGREWGFYNLALPSLMLDEAVYLSSKLDFQQGDVVLLAADLGRFNSSRSELVEKFSTCLLYTSPSPRDGLLSRMPSSA